MTAGEIESSPIDVAVFVRIAVRDCIFIESAASLARAQLLPAQPAQMQPGVPSANSAFAPLPPLRAEIEDKHVFVGRSGLYVEGAAPRPPMVSPPPLDVRAGRQAGLDAACCAAGRDVPQRPLSADGCGFACSSRARVSPALWPPLVCLPTPCSCSDTHMGGSGGGMCGTPGIVIA